MSRSIFILVVTLACVRLVHAQQPASDTTQEVISAATSTSGEMAAYKGRQWGSLIYTDLFTNLFQVNFTYVHQWGDHFGYAGGLHVPMVLAKESGVGLLGELRWYPGKHALSGFYVAPNISYNLYKSKVDGNSYAANAFSGGLMLAYEWIFRSGFVTGVGLGADYFSLERNNPSYTIRDRTGFSPAFRFDLGWAW